MLVISAAPDNGQTHRGFTDRLRRVLSPWEGQGSQQYGLYERAPTMTRHVVPHDVCATPIKEADQVVLAQKQLNVYISNDLGVTPGRMLAERGSAAPELPHSGDSPPSTSLVA